jgi:hypothetical protein
LAGFPAARRAAYIRLRSGSKRMVPHRNQIRPLPNPVPFGLRLGRHNHLLVMSLDPGCSIPDDRMGPRRTALFMARSILRGYRDGGLAC